MPEYSDYIEGLSPASALDGSEIVGLSQGGSPRRVTTQDIANLGSSGSVIGSSSLTTTGGTITMNFSDNIIMVFNGQTSFAAAKLIAHSNDSNAMKYDFMFEITNVAAKLTFPAGYIMSDVRWEQTNPQEWEPAETGKYKATATYDGTNWWLEISAAPYV